jgi:hypothetical protein
LAIENLEKQSKLCRDYTISGDAMKHEMDLATFVAAMASHIAWPAAALIFLYLVRKELPALLQRLKKVSVGGAKAEFDAALDQARKQAQTLKRPEVTASLQATPNERYLKLANEHPEAAVMECFREVERRLGDIKGLLELPSRVSLPGIVSALTERGLLDPEAEPLFQSLLTARNAAVHAKEGYRVTPGEAVDFTYQTWVLTALLDKIIDQLKERTTHGTARAHAQSIGPRGSARHTIEKSEK